MTPYARAAAAVLCCTALISCGAPGQEPAGTASVTSPPTPPERSPDTSPPPVTEPHTATPGPTGTAPVRVDRAAMAPAVVTGVRFGRHPSYERIVVDFDGGVPGYVVRWVRKVYQEGSGDEVDLKGGRALYVLLKPAQAHTESGDATWTGTQVPGSGAITGIVKTGDFEGTVGIALLSRQVRGFEVRELRNPPRLVVDVAT